MKNISLKGLPFACILVILLSINTSCRFRPIDKPLTSKGFEGWYSYLEKHGKNNDADSVFRLSSGVLHISGKEFGYLCTIKNYTNFRLTVEFKWGEAKHAPRDSSKRDSGVLYNFAEGEPDTIWPKSIECQIQEGDCGDFWMVGGTRIFTRNHWTREWNMQHVLRTQDNEKPHGEWNTIEITSDRGELRHYVNGMLVNEGEYPTVKHGKILLQSEGAEVFFRNLMIQSL